MSAANREIREVIRDEHLMRNRILKVLASDSRTIPEIAEKLGRPTSEVTFCSVASCLHIRPRWYSFAMRNPIITLPCAKTGC